jgi:hypothetical protein
MGGFYKNTRFSINDATLVSGARMFVGVHASVAAPVVANSPATMLNCVGIGHVEGATTLSLYIAGSVTNTPTNLGVDFPVAKDVIYDLEIFQPPGDFVLGVTKTTIQVRNVNTGKVFKTTVFPTAANQFPLNTLALNPVYMYRHNNTTASAVSVALYHDYIELKNI